MNDSNHAPSPPCRSWIFKPSSVARFVFFFFSSTQTFSISISTKVFSNRTLSILHSLRINQVSSCLKVTILNSVLLAITIRATVTTPTLLSKHQFKDRLATTNKYFTPMIASPSVFMLTSVFAQQPMQQAQQAPPRKQSGGCLGAILAALCCCCVAEEGCEACADCGGKFLC